MRRFLLLVPACFALLTASTAQQNTPSSAPPPSPERIGSVDAIVDLLQQSYQVNEHLPHGPLLGLLQRQAQMASELRPDLARVWANELLSLASQESSKEGSKEKGPPDTYFRDAAMAVLARVDPDRALELLHTLDLEPPDASAPAMPGNQLVQQVFRVVAERDRENAIPALEREASALGARGHYPYFALGTAAQDTLRTPGVHVPPSPERQQHTEQVLQSVLDVAFANYSQSTPAYLDTIEFGRMLQFMAGSLSPESIQPALHLLVKNLLTTDNSKYSYHADVCTRDAQCANADNAIDASLLWLGPVINRDADLAHQLEATRPELQTALEYTKQGTFRSLSFGGRKTPAKPPARPPDPDVGIQSEALRLTHIDPDKAIARAEQLPAGPRRTNTLLDIARNIAASNPDRAAGLITEVSGGDPAGDAKMQINVISAQAFLLAGKHQQAELRDLLQHGFALTTSNQELQEGIIIGPAPLVELGIQNEPEMTLTFIQGLPPSAMKAELFLSAASGLSLRQPLPFRR